STLLSSVLGRVDFGVCRRTVSTTVVTSGIVSGSITGFVGAVTLATVSFGRREGAARGRAASSLEGASLGIFGAVGALRTARVALATSTFLGVTYLLVGVGFATGLGAGLGPRALTTLVFRLVVF
ncbi:MAG: hypothetical protein IH788_03635, partial [Nitrospinae bacterium]|nr:hypothetical protein [Nitrospinota bacterium]